VTTIDEKSSVSLGWVFALVGFLVSGGVFVAKEAISIDARLTAIETRMDDWEMHEGIKAAKSRIPQ
jgi:hypothetical protein